MTVFRPVIVVSFGHDFECVFFDSLPKEVVHKCHCRLEVLDPTFLDLLFKISTFCFLAIYILIDHPPPIKTREHIQVRFLF